MASIEGIWIESCQKTVEIQNVLVFDVFPRVPTGDGAGLWARAGLEPL